MKEAKKRVRDPGLAKDLDRFSAREGQHYRQHRRFNDVIRKLGFQRLQEFEDHLEAGALPSTGASRSTDRPQSPR